MIENLPKAITPQVTHLKDPDMFWDFISLMPMTTHQVKSFVQEIFLQSFPSSSLIKSKTLMQAMQWYFDPRSLSYSRIVELPTVTDSWTGTIEKWKLQRKKEIIPLIRYGSHTFKMVNEDNEAVYCKFHYKTDQGIKCFDRLVVVIVIIIVIVKMKLFP